MSHATFKVEERELILERVFDAPRELVFRAFEEAEQLKHWWVPRGWMLTECDVDFRPGGVWHYCMKCIDQNQGDFYGYESRGKAVYQEILNGEKIVYMDNVSDGEDNESQGMPPFQITLIFDEVDGKTKLMNRALFPSVDVVETVLNMGIQHGVMETWDRLAELVEAKKQS